MPGTGLQHAQRMAPTSVHPMESRDRSNAGALSTDASGTASLGCRLPACETRLAENPGKESRAAHAADYRRLRAFLDRGQTAQSGNAALTRAAAVSRPIPIPARTSLG